MVVRGFVFGFMVCGPMQVGLRGVGVRFKLQLHP